MEEQCPERPLVAIRHVATIPNGGGDMTKYHSDIRSIYINDPFGHAVEMVAGNEHDNKYVS